MKARNKLKHAPLVGVRRKKVARTGEQDSKACLHFCAMKRVSAAAPFTPMRFRARSSLVMVPALPSSTPRRVSEAISSRPESTSSTFERNDEGKS